MGHSETPGFCVALLEPVRASPGCRDRGERAEQVAKFAPAAIRIAVQHAFFFFFFN